MAEAYQQKNMNRQTVDTETIREHISERISNDTTPTGNHLDQKRANRLYIRERTTVVLR